jgi:hypothetical protein
MTGYNACNLLARLAEEDMSLVDLTHSWDKSNNEPLHERLHLGFVVDIVEELFKIPTTRWEALRVVADDILSSKGVRVQARKLTRLVGTAISMRLALGPITQL